MTLSVKVERFKCNLPLKIVGHYSVAYRSYSLYAKRIA